MVIVNMERHTAREITFKSSIDPGATLSLRDSFSFNVEYYDNNTKGIAKYVHHRQENSPDPRFELAVTMLGYFTCGGVRTEEDKKHAHLQAYGQLFPYMRALIAAMTAASGMPSMIIPKNAMDWDSIVIDGREGK